MKVVSDVHVPIRKNNSIITNNQLKLRTDEISQEKPKLVHEDLSTEIFNTPLQSEIFGTSCREVTRRSITLRTLEVTMTTDKKQDKNSTIETYDFMITVQRFPEDKKRSIFNGEEVLVNVNRPTCQKAIYYVDMQECRKVYSTRLVIEKEHKIFISVLHFTKKYSASVLHYANDEIKPRVEKINDGITVEYFY